MLSHAAKNIGGYGWGFGIHEACDQLVQWSVRLSSRWCWHTGAAFIWHSRCCWSRPAESRICRNRVVYPRPQDFEETVPSANENSGFPRVFCVYLTGAALVVAGFADYPLVAFHFSRTHTVPGQWIAIFYSVAMGVSGSSSLLFGRLFDRFGFRVLILLTVIAATFAPLVFLAGFWLALAGSAVWGMGMGVHESIIPAAVTPMVVQKSRASAFGIFTSAMESAGS